MKEYPETHQKGIISEENDFIFPIEGDFGIQIARDGRVWICINGVAFIRFKPMVGIEAVTKCTKCEESIGEAEFRRNEGLCDKCYKRLHRRLEAGKVV